jgi:hypothetical protein
MESSEERLRAELHKLERLEFELTEQDTLVLEQVKRFPDNAVHASQRDLLRKLVQEVEALSLGYSLPTVDSDDPDSLRPEIRSARAKVIWEIRQIKSQLDLTDVPSKDVASNAAGALNTTTFDAAPEKPIVKRRKEKRAKIKHRPTVGDDALHVRTGCAKTNPRSRGILDHFFLIFAS